MALFPILGGREGKGPALKSTLTKLANMTVGCLTKGGFAMAETLEHFLEHDRHYDPARVSLMLVAAVACTLSDDEDIVRKSMGESYRKDRQSWTEYYVAGAMPPSSGSSS